MSDPDLSNWYTEEQAAGRLGVSVRTLQRLLTEGRSKEFAYAPERRRRARGNGRKPEPVYSPEEVDTLAELARTRVLPPETSSSLPVHFQAPAGMPEGLALALRFLERMAELSGGRLLPAAAAAEKLYLAIPEAAQVSGLSRSLLKRLCRAGHLGFRDGRRWVIPRDDLANSAMVAELARLHSGRRAAARGTA